MGGLQFLELTAPSPSSSCSSPCCSRRSSPTRPPRSELPIPLLDFLSNSLILHYTAPYLSVSAVYALSRTNSRFYTLLLRSSETFRHLDLSRCKAVGGGGADMDVAPIDRGGNNWRSQRMDEALTEDEFYSGPLLGVFNRLASPHANNILRHVTTLVLDGVTVTADLVREIVAEDRFNVRLLSIREVKHLNERKLRQALRYAVRPGRPEGTPKLRGLYIFGPKDPSPRLAGAGAVSPPSVSSHASSRGSMSTCHGGVTNAQGAQLGAHWNARSAAALEQEQHQGGEDWYSRRGRVLRRSPRNPGEWAEWAELIATCEGLIAFDAVLCRGPRHDAASMPVSEGGEVGGGYTGYLPPAIATVALGGCESCGSCVEGPAVFSRSPPSRLPLLAPVPLHASTVRAAQYPAMLPAQQRGPPSFIARCEDCLKSRWCERCNVWWDEGCYANPAMGVQRAQQDPDVKMGSKRECIGCGHTCVKCSAYYSRTCKHCRTSYCLVCNEGSSHDRCDWCSHSRRRARELY